MKINNYNFKQILNCNNYLSLEDLYHKKTTSIYFTNKTNQAKQLLNKMYNKDGDCILKESKIDKENYKFLYNKFIENIKNKYTNILLNQTLSSTINRINFECYIDGILEKEKEILIFNLQPITKTSFLKKIKNVKKEENNEYLKLLKKDENNNYINQLLDIEFIKYVYENSNEYNPYKEIKYYIVVLSDEGSNFIYIDMSDIININDINQRVNKYILNNQNINNYEESNCLNKLCKYYPICHNESNVINNKEYINKEALIKEIKNIQYPIYYLDFESYASIYPRFINEKPYSQHVFLYSLIKQETENSELIYYNYIAKDNINDYRSELFYSLVNNIDKQGTILVYNDTFEKSRIKEASLMFNDIKQDLLLINERIYDLLYLLRGHRNNRNKNYCNNNYYNELQKGSYSIKTMIKIFDGKGYEDMHIKNGVEASISYSNFHLLNEEELQIEKQKLIEYCNKDVYSMKVVLDGIKNKL